MKINMDPPAFLMRLSFVPFLIIGTLLSGFAGSVAFLLIAILSAGVGTSNDSAAIFAVVGYVITFIWVLASFVLARRGAIAPNPASSLQSSTPQTEGETVGNHGTTWLKWLWIPGAVIAAVWIIYAATGDNLGIQVIRNDRFVNDGQMLTITNIGAVPIEIRQIGINERKDCTVTKPIGLFVREETFAAQTLQIGESLTVVGNCRIIRTDILTDKGTSRFSFN